jgi:hypothetical protein
LHGFTDKIIRVMQIVCLEGNVVPAS